MNWFLRITGVVLYLIVMFNISIYLFNNVNPWIGIGAGACSAWALIWFILNRFKPNW